jgi:hypothetical protein
MPTSYQRLPGPNRPNQPKVECPRTDQQHHLSSSNIMDKQGLRAAPNTDSSQPAPHHSYTSPNSDQVGRLLKGFCTSEFQKIINTQCDIALNTFEQLRWTSEIIQCMWDSESEHWKLRNGDKHGHTIAETKVLKHEQLLAIANKLLKAQHTLPARLRKMFPAYSKLTKKHTKNLETWVKMTQQTVHYLLNEKNQANDDPDDNIHPKTIDQPDTTPPTNGLPTPSGSEASQVQPNTTA